ncbi:membrane protein insertase YidC [Verrucosispora sp. WMMD1129]|uniref:membrane protein insertase YidC n=1 Tax=Verrucosispora sp. WMMD1129 TaxID=3016093 RepID=UPI00249C6E62|nr:membrane protein insertase YidC [Verrucosispora sp. WMMD1129]WFE43470.1 membrane protein insertase YidC [Verrucosispora sp. WMMD1129]
MSMIYHAISEILLFWHAAWQRLLGDASALRTDWSWVLGIVFLVLTVRIILFPVFVKQIRSQRAMQALQPRLAELQARHRDDRVTLQKEMVELYRVEKANPLMGCLPMLVQIPVFLGLLHVLRHLKPTMPEHLKTLYGWSVTQFDSASSATLFGAPIAGSFGSTGQELALLGADSATVRIVAAVLIVTMIATTYLSSRQLILRSGWATDPQQRLVQRLMLYGIPASLLVSGLIFPIGVIIYWVTTNLFSLGQQTWMLRRYPPPITATTGPGAPASTPTVDPTRDGDAAGRPAAPKVGAKPTNRRRRRAT